MKNKDNGEHEKLLNQHHELAGDMARVFVSRYKPSQFSFKDIKHFAEIGLWNACRNYDPDKGIFEPYAKVCIQATIMKNVVIEEPGNPIPDAIKAKIKIVRRTANELTTRIGKEPSYEEISQEIGLPIETVEELMEIYSFSTQLKSLDEPIDDNGKRTVGDEIGADDEDTSMQENLIDTETVMKAWPDLDAKIIKMRIKEGFSRRETGEALSLNVDKVRRIEEKRLKELENELGPRFKKRFYR